MGEFEVQLKWIKYLGVWEPQTKLQQKLFYAYRFVAIFLTVYVISGQFTYGYHHRKDIFAVTEVAAPIIGESLLILKLLALWYYSDDILQIIDDVKELNNKWQSQSYNKLISQTKFIERIFSRVFLWNCMFVGLLYALVPLLNDLDNYIMIYSPRPAREMPMKSIFFYDSTLSPAYELTYLLYLFVLWLAPMAHAIVDEILACCSLYICAHFDILRQIINDCELKEFIEYHRKVISLVNELNRIYRFIIFFNYLVLGTFMCLHCFTIVITKEPDKFVVAIVFAFVILSQLFIYSLSGQMIMDKSQEVCEDLRKMDKDYLIIMMRSQQGERIEAGFFHACLPLFTSIVNSTGSTITMLKSFV